MNKLQQSYNAVINAYVEKFTDMFEMDFEGWIGDRIWEVAQFGDYFIDFRDLKYIVDNKVKFSTFYNWYYFVLEYHQKCNINLDSYCRLWRDAQKNNLSVNEFEKKLLYNRIKL